MSALLLVFLGAVILDEYNKSICEKDGETRTIGKSNCTQLIFISTNSPICMQYTSQTIEQVCTEGFWRNKK
jgi:hypothetical protein